MKVLGITGSIATGKSTVTNYLKQRGYLVVDSDKLAYDALTIDEVCIKQTKNRFDLPAGPIDRKALGRIIFKYTTITASHKYSTLLSNNSGIAKKIKSKC